MSQYKTGTIKKERMLKRRKRFIKRVVSLSVLLIAFLVTTLTVFASNEKEINTEYRVPHQERISVSLQFHKDMDEMVSVVLNEESTTTMGVKTEKVNPFDLLSEEEQYYILQCVEIEAEGEGFEGKKAVANVLINRVNSSKFPNTYAKMISQRSYSERLEKYVYQFCSYNSTVWGTKNPPQETYDAIRAAFEEDIVDGAMYFCNEKNCNPSWFNNNLEKTVVIGQHSFYR